MYSFVYKKYSNVQPPQEVPLLIRTVRLSYDLNHQMGSVPRRGCQAATWGLPANCALKSPAPGQGRPAP